MAETGKITIDKINRSASYAKERYQTHMLVAILVQLVSVAGKELDEYLYRNDQLGCYIRNVIAADGKETHNTGKADSEDVCDARSLSEIYVMSTEWGICLSSTRIDEKTNFPNNGIGKCTFSFMRLFCKNIRDADNFLW